MNETGNIKIIRGDGKYPPPTVRKIYPVKALLWKYYFTAFLTWIAAGFSILLFSSLVSMSGEVSGHFPDFIWFFFVFGSLLGIFPLLYILFVYVDSMEYIVHGDEVVVSKGVFNRTVKYCPFRTITNISVRVGLLDSVFGIGSVHVQTAGLGQQRGPEEKLEGLVLHHEIRDYILKQIRIYQQGQYVIREEPAAIKIRDGEENDDLMKLTDRKLLYKEYITELRAIKGILKKKKKG
ncbi:MAG: PH domain-containing protein [Candidatus Odinarchaeota archaeon]